MKVDKWMSPTVGKHKGNRSFGDPGVRLSKTFKYSNGSSGNRFSGCGLHLSVWWQGPQAMNIWVPQKAGDFLVCTTIASQSPNLNSKRGHREWRRRSGNHFTVTFGDYKCAPLNFGQRRISCSPSICICYRSACQSVVPGHLGLPNRLPDVPSGFTFSGYINNCYLWVFILNQLRVSFPE
jgi:hypothetical protein